MQPWFSFPSDHFPCIFTCVIRHPVYYETKSQCMSEWTGFTVFCPWPISKMIPPSPPPTSRRIQFNSPASVLGGAGKFKMTSWASWDFSMMTSFSLTAVCMRRIFFLSLENKNIYIYYSYLKNLFNLKYTEIDM